MSYLRRLANRRGREGSVAVTHQDAEGTVYTDGNLKYTVEEGGNNSNPSYQEASGAPVESLSPLGTHVGFATAMFLNIGKMIGTGVFSTPASILTNSGSVGLSLFMWVLGYFLAISGLSVYLEFAAYFPNRSGAETVYLEQAYPRPKYFFPVAFAIQTVLLSFSASNAIVLSQYLYRLAGVDPTAWQMKGVAAAAYTIAVLFVIFNTKYSLWLSNAIGVIKVLTLVFISITGLVVLGGHTRVPDPHANFRDGFAGTTASAYGITNALIKILFAYQGYENAFSVVNEVKNPIRTLKRSAPASVTVVGILYLLVNIAFFAAVSVKDLKGAKTTAAALFFQAVFGTSGAARGLNFLIMLSAFGNLVTVLIGHSRLIRECGRQGVLPFPRFWSSTRPFGTPLGPYLLKWGMTLLMILAPPAGDAFNFVVDLATFPDAFFKFLMAVGLLILRYRRQRINLPRADFKAWDILVAFYILINLYMVVMPWYPPEGGQYAGDVSFWYGTYVVTGVAIIIVSAIYYWIWTYVIPKWKNYTVRQETLILDNGALAHRLVKVPNADLERWDIEHDVTGNVIEGLARLSSSEDDAKRAGVTKTEKSTKI